jgi:hypothetical protein
VIALTFLERPLLAVLSREWAERGCVCTLGLDAWDAVRVAAHHLRDGAVVDVGGADSFNQDTDITDFHSCTRSACVGAASPEVDPIVVRATARDPRPRLTGPRSIDPQKRRKRP